MSHEDWLSVYGEYLSPNPRDSKFRDRQANFGTGSIYVYNCEFNKCESSDSHGGAIFVSSTETTKALFEKCSFFKCKTTSSSCNGAAIYFRDKGNCTISQACGHGCYSANHYAFSYVYCTDNAKYKNFVEDSSISYSESPGSNTMCHYYGNILMKGVNCSHNKNNKNCIYCWPTYSSEVTCFLTSCSIVNNTVKQYTIICFSNNIPSYKLVLCNIIKNAQEDRETQATLMSYGNTEVALMTDD